PLLAGITQEAARLLDPEYSVHPAVNWYFMMGSTFLVTAIGALVTIFVVEPRLGVYDASRADPKAVAQLSMEPLSSAEWRGLRWALASVLVLAALVLRAVVPEHGVLRSPQSGSVLDSPFLRGTVAPIFVFFRVPGF